MTIYPRGRRKRPLRIARTYVPTGRQASDLKLTAGLAGVMAGISLISFGATWFAGYQAFGSDWGYLYLAGAAIGILGAIRLRAYYGTKHVDCVIFGSVIAAVLSVLCVLGGTLLFILIAS